MDLNIIRQKIDFFLPIILFCWLLFYIGNQYVLQQVCVTHNAKLYFFIRHDFMTAKEFTIMNSEYHCLQEIEEPTCFAGQKQILYETKCKINEKLGVDYGYISAGKNSKRTT
jgi:hypothetical protein